MSPEARSVRCACGETHYINFQDGQTPVMFCRAVVHHQTVVVDTRYWKTVDAENRPRRVIKNYDGLLVIAHPDDAEWESGTTD